MFLSGTSAVLSEGELIERQEYYAIAAPTYDQEDGVKSATTSLNPDEALMVTVYMETISLPHINRSQLCLPLVVVTVYCFEVFFLSLELM